MFKAFLYAVGIAFYLSLVCSGMGLYDEPDKEQVPAYTDTVK